VSISKKNIVDPEDIIQNFGADAIRWFMLSDSPPGRDIQWSNEGISSSYKFIQKMWNLNSNIIGRNKQLDNAEDSQLDEYTNKMIFNITKNLDNFQYNVVIANFYDIYNNYSRFIENKKISNDILIKNFEKVLILIMPLLPHFASECLITLNSKLNLGNISWPTYDKTLIEASDCNIVVQINGKKRGLILTEKIIKPADLINEIKKTKEFEKFIVEKTIIKTIFIKDKLINLILK
jgi:leucyl-tRNA synthetase